MRLYGKKFLKRNMERSSESKIETRDGILWDVLPVQRLCRVKIQGSSQLITAHYPENWEQTPFWMKKGNAVRITHMGGKRGRIEVVGHGQLIPTPISGGTFPASETPPDAILTGCSVTQVPNNPKMAVHVHIGTYRIGGIDYILDSIPMLYGDNLLVGDGGTMDDISGAVPINAAPASGYFRYDLISVGTNGVIDYTPGTPATSEPERDDPEGSHIALGYILLHSGMTSISNSDINKSWTTPYPVMVTVTPADNDLAWAELQTNVEVKVLDQYGNGIIKDGYGWYLTIEFVIGNGSLYSAEDGWQTDHVGQHAGAYNHYDFIYKRDQLDPGDESPILKGTVELDYSRYGYASIILRDAGGDPM
jgi:hypothetical protein